MEQTALASASARGMFGVQHLRRVSVAMGSPLGGQPLLPLEMLSSQQRVPLLLNGYG